MGGIKILHQYEYIKKRIVKKKKYYKHEQIPQDIVEKNLDTNPRF